MKLLNIFPIPKFLKMPIFGLDISDESVKYLRFGFDKKCSSDGWRIDFYGEKMIPPGIILNGDIIKEKEFTDFLKSSFRDIEIKNAVMSLPEEKAYLDIVKFPKTDYKNIRNGLFAQLENYFPLKAGDAVFDFEILDENSGFLNILVAAYPLNLIMSYRNCLMQAGINPLAFEHEGDALHRALTREDDKSFKIIIDFGKTRTSFFIIKGKNTIFTSTAKIGGDDLNKALALAFSVSREEAEIIKRERAKIFPITNRKDDIKTEEIKIQECLMPIISSLIQETRKHIDYLENRFGEDKIRGVPFFSVSKILLCGGDANMPGISEHLSFELKIPVYLAHIWQNIFSFENYIPEIEFNESLRYATAAGLALKSRESRWE